MYDVINLNRSDIMEKAIVHINYDPTYLEENQIDLENEIEGWLQDSNIEVDFVEKHTGKENLKTIVDYEHYARETVWRITEEDVRCVIERKYPNLSDDRKYELVKIAYKEFTFPDWAEPIELFLSMYASDKLEDFAVIRYTGETTNGLKQNSLYAVETDEDLIDPLVFETFKSPTVWDDDGELHEIHNNTWAIYAVDKKLWCHVRPNNLKISLP